MTREEVALKIALEICREKNTFGHSNTDFPRRFEEFDEYYTKALAYVSSSKSFSNFE